MERTDGGARTPQPEAVRGLAPWRRFHLRVTAFFGVLAFALLGVMGGLSYRWARETELAAVTARLGALSITLAEGLAADDVAAALADGEPSSPAYQRMIATFAATAVDEPDVQSIYVAVRTEREGWLRFAADWVRTGTPAAVGEDYDATEAPRMLEAFGGPRVEEEMTTDAWGQSLSGYAPVHDARGRAVAVLGVDVDAARVARIEREVSTAIGLVYGAALLVIVLSGLWLGRSIRRPVARIVEAAGEIVRDPSTRVGLGRADELGLIARHFDRMAAGLEERERIRAVFGRYVSDDVARRVLASPDAERLGGEVREITVLFIDLSGYGSVGGALDPAAVVAMLERYLGAMTELVEAHGGCVIEMLGDAILAVFGAPDPLDDHPERAVRCGLAMRARLEALNDAWEAEGLARAWKERGVARLRPRIGIHTGRVVAGNTGGRTRMKYAVIGDTVNVAARIEVLNERLGTTLLVSAEVLERLPAELAGGASAKGAHQVKGRARAVDVHAL